MPCGEKVKAGGQSSVPSNPLGVIGRLHDCQLSSHPICQGAGAPPSERALGGPVNSDSDHSHSRHMSRMPSPCRLFFAVSGVVSLASPYAARGFCSLSAAWQVKREWLPGWEGARTLWACSIVPPLAGGSSH